MIKTLISRTEVDWNILVYSEIKKYMKPQSKQKEKSFLSTKIVIIIFAAKYSIK